MVSLIVCVTNEDLSENELKRSSTFGRGNFAKIALIFSTARQHEETVPALPPVIIRGREKSNINCIKAS
jgi:hypothetical protein